MLFLNQDWKCTIFYLLEDDYIYIYILYIYIYIYLSLSPSLSPIDVYLDFHILHIQVWSKVVWQVEQLQPWSSNSCRSTVGKGDSINKASWIQKRIGFRIIPRIMLESYLKLPNSERWSFARAELVFCEHKSFLRNHWRRAMSPAAWKKNPTTVAPQRHPAMAPTCQLQSAGAHHLHQSAGAHHFHCSTLKQHLTSGPPYFEKYLYAVKTLSCKLALDLRRCGARYSYIAV